MTDRRDNVKRKPNLFDTWDGKKSVYILNEDQQHMAISTSGPEWQENRKAFSGTLSKSLDRSKDHIEVW